MGYISGFTATQLIAMVCDATNLDSTKSSAEILRELNASQLQLYAIADFPELRVEDAELTTDGSNYYDLTTAIATNLGRIIDGTVRCGSINLDSFSKVMIEQYDPDKSYSGTPIGYACTNRKRFRVFPYGSSGATVTLDYITLPVEIESTTTASDISFLPDRHELIANGAIWRIIRNKTNPTNSGSDWMNLRKIWLDDVKDLLRTSRIKYASKELVADVLPF